MYPLELVQLLKAIADENRMRILNLLNMGELCVCEIEEILGIQQSNASRHLNKLKTTGLIRSDKKSQWVYYRLNDETMNRYPSLKTILEQEFRKIGICRTDLEHLKEFKASGLSCEDLTNNHCPHAKTCKKSDM